MKFYLNLYYINLLKVKILLVGEKNSLMFCMFQVWEFARVNSYGEFSFRITIVYRQTLQFK